MINEDANLFGVEPGALRRLQLEWESNEEGASQWLRIWLHWENRKPTMILVTPPEEMHLANVISPWLPVLLNGYWISRNRLYPQIGKMVATCKSMGASVVVRGTRIPSG